MEVNLKYKMQEKKMRIRLSIHAIKDKKQLPVEVKGRNFSIMSLEIRKIEVIR